MSIALKIAKRLVKALFYLFIAAITVFLLWRMLASSDPSSIKSLDPNEKLVDLYAEQGKKMEMFYQEQRNVTSGDDNYGYFMITQTAVIPDANQVQTVLKYNNSTLRHTAEDKGLDAVPSRDDEVYDVSLLLAIDLTPDEEEDNYGNDENSVKFVRCKGTVVASAQKNLYNFRRVVFQLDDAEIDIKQLIGDKLLLAMYVDVYYVGDVNYENAAYGTLCIYDFKSENVKVKLEKDDIKAIEKYEKNN